VLSLSGDANADSICPTTKAIEVCVNGVKQVIIIPQAPSSNDITTVSTAAFLPSCLTFPLSSSVGDTTPEDVKLLAESCRRVSSPLPVSSFNKCNVSLAATTGCVQGSASAPSQTILPPPPYPMFGINRMPYANSLSDSPRHPFMPAAPQFYPNPCDNRATFPPGAIPQFSPTFPVNSSLATNPLLSTMLGLPPAQQSSCPVPPHQPFPFAPTENLVLPGPQIQRHFNHFQHPLQMPTNQAPWSSYSLPPMRPTYGSRDTAVNGVNNSYPYLPYGPVIPPLPLPRDLSLSNHRSIDYRRFLPPHLCMNQLQDYLTRKRGVLPQNSHVNGTGEPLTVPNCYIPQLDPRFFANTGSGMPACRPPPVTANALRAAIASNQTHSWQSTAGHLSTQGKFNSVMSTSARRRGVTRAQAPSVICVAQTNSSSTSSSISSSFDAVSTSSETRVRFETPDVWCRLQTVGTSHCTTSPACQTRPALVISSPSDQPLNSPRQSVSVDYWKKQRERGMWISNILQADQSGNMMSCSVTLSLTSSSSTCQTSHGTWISNMVQSARSGNMCCSVASTLASSSATVTTHAMETPVAAVSSASTLACDIASDLSVRSVPSNCSLTSNPSLSNLLASDLFPLNMSLAVTESGSVLQSGTAGDMATSQLGDTLGDLDCLPADMMIETSESESLLTSFCRMFEQSNGPHLQPASSLVSSDCNSNKLSNSEPLKGVAAAAVQHKTSSRDLQFAKSLGKGRHFAEEMRRRHEGQTSRKRRRTRLTSLEVADDSNSSDSWHPDSQSESSEYQSPSPAPSMQSSVSWSSDDFVVVSRPTKKQWITRRRRKRASRHVIWSADMLETTAVDVSPSVVTSQCSVVLERLRLNGQNSVNIHAADGLVCCQRRRVKRLQRIVSSDSDGSAADSQPDRKRIRIKIRRIEDNDST